MQLSGKEEKTKKLINPPVSVLVEPGKSQFILLYQESNVFTDALGPDLANVLQLLGEIPGGEWTYRYVPPEAGTKLLGSFKEDDKCSVTSISRDQPEVGQAQTEHDTRSSNTTISSIDNAQDEPALAETPDAVLENLSPLIGNWRGYFGTSPWNWEISLQIVEQDGQLLRGYGSVSGSGLTCNRSPVTVTPDSSYRYFVKFSGGSCDGEGELEHSAATLGGRIKFSSQTKWVTGSLTKAQ
jgi:hypothetical protein